MFCRKCGRGLVNGSKFCGKCGYQTLEWEKESISNNVPQYTQPVTPPKQNNTWIIVLVLIIFFVVFVVPGIFFLLFIILIFSLPTIESDNFDYVDYIHVNYVEVETLHGIDHGSLICDSSGYDYSDHIVLEYCSGEVSQDQIDEYVEYFKNNDYDYDEDYNKLSKRFEDGEVIITISGEDEVKFDYRFRNISGYSEDKGGNSI